MEYFLGIDVGTSSVRCILCDETGFIHGSAQKEITTYRDATNSAIFEQSTYQIWDSILLSLRTLLDACPTIPREAIQGIGCDATCSLVLCEEDGTPLSVTPSNLGQRLNENDGKGRDVILWMDHRSLSSSQYLNTFLLQSSSHFARSLGSSFSPELELPRSHYLKSHLPPALWEKCRVVGLPDWLGWKLTGKWTRGVGTCAMNGLGRGSGSGDEGRVAREFFEGVGLAEYISPNSSFNPLSPSSLLLSAGQPIASLLPSLATALSLSPSTTIASGAIDSHAGWAGTIATSSHDEQRVSVVGGTSTCFVVQGKEKVFVDGVWGAFESAVCGGSWMNEGGSSATGQLLDFIIDTHPASSLLVTLASTTGKSKYATLNDLVQSMAKAKDVPFVSYLTRGLHLYPDFHGNRSPLADASMRGIISGLRLDGTMDDLVLRYLATLEALAFQTKHTIDALNGGGHDIGGIQMSGGLAQNELLMELTANICQLPVQLPYYPKASVVLGSAILGAVASNAMKQGVQLKTQEEANEHAAASAEAAWEIMAKMTRTGKLVDATALPDSVEDRLNKVKYDIYLDMIVVQRRWRSKVEEALKV